MIRLYAYYSCGGYKDMYLGSSDTAASPSYFLPLLPVMKKRGRKDEVEKIKYQEALQHVCIVTSSESYGFPADAANMFSHGAYKTVYRTLQDGSSCLSMHDIPSNETDEEGRDIPFTLMFVADGEEDSAKLDCMAAALLKDMAAWQQLFTSLFAYDPIVNGIKFDLSKIMARINDTKQESNCYIDRTQSKNVAYLMLNENNGVKIALKEQNLKREEVSCFVDANGNIIEGCLPLVDNVKPLVEEQKLLAKEKKPLAKEEKPLAKEEKQEKEIPVDKVKEAPAKEKSFKQQEDKPKGINDNSILERLTKMEKQLDELKNIVVDKGTIDKFVEKGTSYKTEIVRLINEINNQIDFNSVKEQLEKLHNKQKSMTLSLIVITTLIAILQIINML